MNEKLEINKKKKQVHQLKKKSTQKVTNMRWDIEACQWRHNKMLNNMQIKR